MQKNLAFSLSLIALNVFKRKKKLKTYSEKKGDQGIKNRESIAIIGKKSRKLR